MSARDVTVRLTIPQAELLLSAVDVYLSELPGRDVTEAAWEVRNEIGAATERAKARARKAAR